LIYDKVQEIVLDPLRARGLAFCVSIAHAEFMAEFFNSRGVPSISITGDAERSERRNVQSSLVSRQINFVFVVDLYNEGIDIPEVDTLLFLRPTESLTVFLQQLGRGLRLHEEKDTLTVIDFIGSQHREFRFSLRYRALSVKPELNLERELLNGFPHLPTGCLISLEKVAQENILRNIQHHIRLSESRIVSELKNLWNVLNQIPTIEQALDYLHISLEELLNRGLWSSLLTQAGALSLPACQDEKQLEKGFVRLSHVDDERLLRVYLRKLNNANSSEDSEDERSALSLLHVTLWGKSGTGWSVEDANARLVSNPTIIYDLRELFEYNLRHAFPHKPVHVSGTVCHLSLHSQYTRDEILVGLGYWTLAHRPDHREGVLHLPKLKVDVLFVTLQKTEAEFSATTMYEDYLISPTLFHWQTQSSTSVDSPTGKRYLHHSEFGYTPLLFVRDAKTSDSGRTSPYVFLGPCVYQSHSGSRPISITWKLTTPVPARYLGMMARQAVI